MSWRLYSRDTQGDENVAMVSSREAALTRARAHLVEGGTIIRIESEDGEILEGKQLQEALTTSRDRSKMH